MISVILYGRNDAHGYNLHRRAALSLNCIAEVLTDPDDELIFVDYNTPDELPTFIEAIADTLTERCLSVLRVLRVRAAIHEQRFSDRTHLPALEPIARNVAARRAKASNRWLLSTNTDMIFVPLQHGSMSEICRELPDGFYGLPRFELPEWLWERLPRTDPRNALEQVGRLGPALRLDEPTLSHEWIRFDAPGDFQLILREDFLAIDGFNEEMILGYHVDSNLSRRLLLRRGAIKSLEGQLAGYHCNHNRTLTVYHAVGRVENDLQDFFFSIDQAELPEQRVTWGLHEVPVEEVAVRQDDGDRATAALIEAIPTGPRTTSDAWGAPYALSYDSGHVLPFIADTLLVSPRDTTIGYLGVNTILERMLAEVVTGLGFERPVAAARFDDTTAIDRIGEVADVFVVDLGLDVSEDKRGFPHVLAYTLPALDRLVKLERGRREQGKHPRPMVLVNSTSGFWGTYVLGQFDCSYTTIHSRVRRATVKVVPEGGSDAFEIDPALAYRVLVWYARDKIGGPAIVTKLGENIELTELDDYGGFGNGWATPEETGIWTEGERSELAVAVEDTDGLGAGDECVLTLDIALICIRSGDALGVKLLANGTQVATRVFSDPVERPWRVDLPAEVLREGAVALSFLVDEPRSPRALGWSSDKRRLGIHLRTLRVEEVDRSVRFGERIEFCEGSGAERFLGDGWSRLEPTGVWSIEDRALLVFRPIDVPEDAELFFEVLPFLTAEHRKLDVDLFVCGERLAGHSFRHDSGEQSLHVRLPTGLIQGAGRLVAEFRLRKPARPVDFGLGSDPRRLGLYLRSLTVRRPGSDVRVQDGGHGLGKLRAQLARSIRS